MYDTVPVDPCGCGEDSDKPVSRTLRSFVKNNLASLLLSMIVYRMMMRDLYQKLRSLIASPFFRGKIAIFP